MKKTIIALTLVFLCLELPAQDKKVELAELIEKKEQRNDLLIYGGIGLAIVITGVLVFRFFNNTKTKKADSIPVIKTVFPSPSHGPVTIQLEGNASQLQVLDRNGKMLKAFAIAGNEMHFDLSSWPRGKYMVVAHYGANKSNAVEFILQ